MLDVAVGKKLTISKRASNDSPRPKTIVTSSPSHLGADARIISWKYDGQLDKVEKFLIYHSLSPEKFAGTPSWIQKDVSISNAIVKNLKIGNMFQYFKVGVLLKDGNTLISLDTSSPTLVGPCPEGAFCDPASGTFIDQIQALNTWWKSPFKKRDGMPQFIKCGKGGRACIGVDPSSPNSTLAGVKFGCRDGFRGAACSACGENYAKSEANGGCSECMSKGSHIAVLVIGLGAVAAAFSYIAHRSIKSKGRPHNVYVMMLKIGFNHLQCISVLALLPFEWPLFITKMFSATTVISASKMFSVECFTKGISSSIASYVYAETIIVAAMPLVLAAFIFAFYGIREYFNKNINGVRRAKTALVVFLCLAYIILVEGALRVFTCRSVDDDNNAYLVADPSIWCWGDDHTLWVNALAWPMVVVYGVGIPAILLALTKRAQSDHKRFRTVYGFLYSSYIEKCWYWEAVVMFRKGILAYSAIMLAPVGSVLQINCVLLTIGIALFLQLSWQPYLDKRLNNLEVAGISVQFLTANVGVFTSQALVSSSFLRTISSIFIILVNILYFGYLSKNLLNNRHIQRAFELTAKRLTSMGKSSQQSSSAPRRIKSTDIAFNIDVLNKTLAAMPPNKDSESETRQIGRINPMLFATKNSDI